MSAYITKTPKFRFHACTPKVSRREAKFAAALAVWLLLSLYLSSPLPGYFRGLRDMRTDPAPGPGVAESPDPRLDPGLVVTVRVGGVQAPLTSQPRPGAGHARLPSVVGGSREMTSASGPGSNFMQADTVSTSPLQAPHVNDEPAAYDICAVWRSGGLASARLAALTRYHADHPVPPAQARLMGLTRLSSSQAPLLRVADPVRPQASTSQGSMIPGSPQAGGAAQPGGIASNVADPVPAIAARASQGSILGGGTGAAAQPGSVHSNVAPVPAIAARASQGSVLLEGPSSSGAAAAAQPSSINSESNVVPRVWVPVPATGGARNQPRFSPQALNYLSASAARAHDSGGRRPRQLASQQPAAANDSSAASR